jgi:hypothetical protein
MAPKPRPLDERDTVLHSNFGNTENPASGNPNHVGVFSLEHEQQENLEPSQRVNHTENVQSPQAKNAGPIRPYVHVTKRAPTWFARKQERDPTEQFMDRQSMSDQQENKRTTQSDYGIMLREGDFLDRTFDNVENVTCHRTSISKAPPAPIFSCNSPGNGHYLNSEVEYDIAALSSAKQQGYNIEQFDENDDVDQVVQTSTSGRPPLVPVNSILEEQSSGAGAPRWDNAERADSVPKKDMLDLIFENFHGLIWPEDRSLAIRTEHTNQRESPQLQTQQRNETNQGTGDDDSDNGELAILSLNKTLSDSKSEKMMSGCNSILTNGGMPPTGFSSEISPTNPSFRREAFDPIRNEYATPPNQGSKLRTGMMLLADGSIVELEENSKRWIKRQQRSTAPSSSGTMYTTSSNAQKSNSSIRLSRESSLLDMLSRSGEASESEMRRMSSLRNQKRMRSPRQTYDEEKTRGDRTKTRNTGSVEDIESQNFWKQVAFAATVLLLACGLILVAISFVWPLHKMT